ncbi:MAG: hypothetical protein AAB403_23135 [Planctomycetota bacterium]
MLACVVVLELEGVVCDEISRGPKLRKRHQYRLLQAAFVFALIGIAFFGAYAGMETAEHAGQRPPNPKGHGGGYLSAFWHWITHDAAGFFTLTLCGITGWLAYVTRGLYVATARLADDSKEASAKAIAASTIAANAAVAAQRPWIKIDIEIASDVIDDGHGLRMGFKVTVQNVGNTPATAMNVWIAMVCGPGAVLLNAGADKTPDRFDDLSIPVGSALFPRESAEFERYGRLVPHEIESALAQSTTAIGHVDIVVIATADYRFAGGEGQTVGRYFLLGSKIFNMIDVRSPPISQSGLRLKKMLLGDIAS